MSRSLRHFVLFAGFSILLGRAGRAQPTLAANSPFLPPDGAAVTATENTPLELRGIMTDASGYRFSIYDPVKKSGQWVRLNESGHDFTVKTHNVTGNSVMLEYQGRMLTLALRSAKVVGVAVPEPTAGPKPNAVVMGGGPVPHPPTAEEKERYNRAVDEINRRRMAREKNPGALPMPQPQTQPR